MGERVEEMRMEVGERGVSLGVVVEAGVLGLAGLLLSLFFFIFNVRLRSNRLIKMSSPVLNLFIAGGGILLSVCTTLYGMDYFLADFTGVSSAVCKSRVGLLACGFSLMFGPMFLKSWRVYRLFQNAGRKRVIIRDSRLLLMTGGLLLLDVALLLIWQTTDPVQFRPMSLFRQMEWPGVDSNSSAPLQITQIYSCTSPSSPTWLAIFLAFKMALLCYGLFLSWRTRAVALPAMNDSQCIVVSSLTTVTMATLTLSVSHVLPEYPNVVYACVVFSIWLCTVMTLCVAFVPKVSLWWRNPEAKDLRVSVTSAGSSSSPLFPLLHLEEELGQVVAENEALRKSLEEKDSSIRQLQQHLTNAYRHLSHLGLNLGLIQDSGQDADFSSSDSENPADFPQQTVMNRLTASRQPSHVDSQTSPPFCGGNFAKNDHSCLQIIKAGDFSGIYAKGGNRSEVKLEKGGVLPSRDSGVDLSLCDRKCSGVYSASGVSISHSGSDQNSQSSNADGESTVFLPSIHSRQISKQITQAGSSKSYNGGQLVPSLHPGNLSRRCSEQNYFVFPPAQKTCKPTHRNNPHDFVRENSNTQDSIRGNTNTQPHPASSRKTSAFSETARASSVHGSGGKSWRRKRRHQRRHSANSVTSADKLSELRAAIALDLQRARSLSNVLSNSVSKELDNVYRRHSRQLRRRSSSIKSREELAESIVGSYGLEDNTDTLSYVSSYLPLPSLQDRNQDLVTSRREFSVLDSDAFYPERRHKDSVTSLSRKKWSDAPSSSVVDRSIKIGDRGKGRDIISYQRSCPQTDREERDTKYLAGQNKNKGQTLTSSGKNVNSNTYNAASLGDGGDDISRSEPGLQERGVGQQEVFSVYSAQPAYFVQKGYAHTRPLYSVDTFI